MCVCAQTFLSKPEIITCIHKCKTECNKVLNLSLYTTGYTKSVTDEEFKASQEMGLASTVTYLKESWTSALKSAVKSSLKEIGKGWFNLNETRTEVYAMSKLKRFLKMVNFLMQDCVITMAEASLHNYADFVIERSSYQIEVISCSEVVATPFGGAIQFSHLPPLFVTDLEAKDGECVGYRVEPSDFVTAVLGVFDKGSASVQDIPQVHTRTHTHAHLLPTSLPSHLSLTLHTPSIPPSLSRDAHSSRSL